MKNHLILILTFLKKVSARTVMQSNGGIFSPSCHSHRYLTVIKHSSILLSLGEE